ncbi:MAG TPA: twin-arginine translocation pathway signal [Xanthobacteraceae bacterium]|nr:twin-arginine translocation pathway signal [Xanthobacteraceae bacterium]
MRVRSITASILRAGALALIAFGAAACSTSSNLDVMLFADPGKYEYHTCAQILKSGEAVAARELQLRALIQKAEQGAGGALVSTVAYRGEYRTVVEELAVIDGVSRRKNCNTPPSWRSSTAIQ